VILFSVSAAPTARITLNKICVFYVEMPYPAVNIAQAAQIAFSA
jgi:hypothetical protein